MSTETAELEVWRRLYPYLRDAVDAEVRRSAGAASYIINIPTPIGLVPIKVSDVCQALATAGYQVTLDHPKWEKYHAVWEASKR